MQITLSSAGKRFSREWIFRNLNYDFLPGIKYAVTGPNGSGKSTLLQVICGSLLMNEGNCAWRPAQDRCWGSSSQPHRARRGSQRRRRNARATRGAGARPVR